MKIVEGTIDNFKQEVLKSDKPVLVDFNAEWCPPCQALHPTLEELSKESDDFNMSWFNTILNSSRSRNALRERCRNLLIEYQLRHTYLKYK